MNKTHKKLALVSIAAFVIEAAVVIGVATNLSGNILSPIKADTVDSSVTFTNFENIDGVGAKISSLHNGGTIKAYSVRPVSGSNASLAYGKQLFFCFMNNGVSNTSISVGGNSYEFAPFENLTSIQATYSGGGELYAYTSTDGSTFSSGTKVTSGKNLDISGAKYLYLKNNSDYDMLYVSSVSLSYTCNGGPVEKALSSISLSGTYQTAFEVGDTFNHTGAVVTAHYNDSTSSDVTSSATFTTPDLSSKGEKTVTVSYTEAGVTKTTSYSVTVSEPGSIILSGTYNYKSRKDHDTPNWWAEGTRTMTITFNSDGTCVWNAIRNLFNADCKVYFTYTVVEQNDSLSISLLYDSYDYKVNGQTSTSASAWSGGSTDRPTNGSLGAGVKNDSGVMSLDRSTLTIKVYEYYSSSYHEYDTFTFKLQS